MTRVDELIPVIDDGAASAPPPAEPWLVLLVDDDADVHESTRYALRGLQILQRPLQLLHAHSAAEGLALLRRQTDVAVLLLDVVMESEHAGLEMVQAIRGELGQAHLRIVLRTGQPGQAPELETIRRYDINDYKTKSELTRTKLFVTLTTAIRSYDQLRRLDDARRGLEQVVAAGRRFIAEQGMVEFAEGLLEQLGALLAVPVDGLVCACLEAEPDEYLVIAAAGSHRPLLQQRLAELADEALSEALRQSLRRRRDSESGGRLLLYVPGRGQRDFVACIGLPAPLTELQRQLLAAFGANVALCAANLALLARLREHAYVDRLLGIANRTALVETLDRRIGDGSLAGQVLVQIDIDQFAETNDMFGHRFGDALLQALARRLTGVLEPACEVARVAGNTFAVLGPAAKLEPESLRRLVEEPLVVESVARRLSVCMSFVRCDDAKPADGNELLKDAAIALKRAKAGGQGRSAWFTRAIGADSKERTRLLHGLHRAFDHDRLFLAFQPQIELASGRVVGIEALMRWRADDGSLVPPERFIPVAEQSGLIVGLGVWCLRSALDALAELDRGGHAGLQMAVNVSAVQFAHADFLGQLDLALADKGLAPGRLELEITESISAVGLERVADVLGQVRRRGIGVAIDDFGTGFSSLSYLDRLPADRLKIDRAFVQLLDTDRPGARIARMIVPLGHQLGMRVLAEGVEKASQLQALREMGCDEAQGYLFARPMPLDELERWMTERRDGGAT